jgi:hypothetical protein
MYESKYKYKFAKNSTTMKKLLQTIVFCIIALQVQAQIPDTVWTRTKGGTGTELIGSFATVSQYFGRFSDIAVDQNNTIFIASTSNSSDFDVKANFGNEDIWVIGLHSNGDTLWTKIYGGSESERVSRVKPATGGGCYIVGHSRSSNGSFTTNHSTTGYADGFVIRLDGSGNQLWMTLYGGTDDDFLYDIIETSDGHLIACGETYSVNGDLAGTGSGMNWALKLNPANGNIIWSKTYLGPDGSSNDRLENVFRLSEMSDNSIVMTGYSTPDWNDFNLDRVSILKIDLAGNLSWSKKIGAPGSGDYPTAILPSSGGDFYILAKLAGTIGGGGDATNYYGGGGDFWLVKLNSAGNIILEKNYGGTELDVPYDMIYSQDGNIYLAGMTRSINNDASASQNGGTDFWLLKVNFIGDTIYTKRLGGSSNDFCSGIAKAEDGYTLYMVGGTDSNDGMVSGFKGVRDLWIVKMAYPLGTQLSDDFVSSTLIYPNPASHSLTITSQQSFSFVHIIDMQGKTLLSTKFQETINISHLPNGNYIIVLLDENKRTRVRHPLIIQK